MAIWTNYTSKSTPADNDTLLEYDATGGALKQTPFSGVYNWLQAKIHALTASTGAWAPSTDKLLTDRNGTLSRIDYSVLAKAIVEEYAGSSVAGANQAIKTALDSLNSKTWTLSNSPNSNITSGQDLDSFLTPGVFDCASSSIASSLLHCPTDVTTGFRLIVTQSGYGTSSYAVQIILMGSGSVGTPREYRRAYVGGSPPNGTWSNWEKTPTRAEMDAVSSKVSSDRVIVTNLLTYVRGLPRGFIAFYSSSFEDGPIASSDFVYFIEKGLSSGIIAILAMRAVSSAPALYFTYVGASTSEIVWRKITDTVI